jgi:hypothetical protein
MTRFWLKVLPFIGSSVRSPTSSEKQVPKLEGGLPSRIPISSRPQRRGCRHELAVSQVVELRSFGRLTKPRAGGSNSNEQRRSDFRFGAPFPKTTWRLLDTIRGRPLTEPQNWCRPSMRQPCRHYMFGSSQCGSNNAPGVSRVTQCGAVSAPHAR